MSDAINPTAPPAIRRQKLLAAIQRAGGAWTGQRAWELYEPRPEVKSVRADLQALCTAGLLIRIKAGLYELR